MIHAQFRISAVPTWRVVGDYDFEVTLVYMYFILFIWYVRNTQNHLSALLCVESFLCGRYHIYGTRCAVGPYNDST